MPSEVPRARRITGAHFDAGRGPCENEDMVAWALTLTVLAQQPAVTTVAVIDVSAPDAIYEDLSRRVAERVVVALESAGVRAVRVDENELPEEGCRIGPCLGVAARAKGAQVVVMVDAAEEGKKAISVRLAGLWSTNGAPVAVATFQLPELEAPVPKIVARFAKKVAQAAPP